MEQALLNTAMGISIVFIALIFISFCIYLLKFIPQFVELFKGNKEEKAAEITVAKKQNIAMDAKVAAATPATASESVRIEDDSELIAVISAAIAAAMSESTGQIVAADGLIIRKIKRRRV